MSDISEITLASRVVVSPDVLIQEVQGESVLLDLKTGIYFGLDRVGTRMWNLLADRRAISDVSSVITAEFAVGADRCADDIIALVGKLREQGLLAVE